MQGVVTSHDPPRRFDGFRELKHAVFGLFFLFALKEADELEARSLNQGSTDSRGLFGIPSSSGASTRRGMGIWERLARAGTQWCVHRSALRN